LADPRIPYPITGLLQDTDGSTAVSGGYVVVYNVDLQESIEGRTDASGQFMLDLANLTSAYAEGHILHILCWDRNKSTWHRHTVDVSAGALNLGSIPLHIGAHHTGRTRVNVIVVSNKKGTVGHVDFVDGFNNDTLLSIEVAANGTESVYLAQGLVFKSNICVLREDDTANYFEVCIIAGG